MAYMKIGILHIPSLDENASLHVRRLLHERVTNAIVVLENHAGHQRYWIEEVLARWCDEEELDVILTIGATMPAPGPSGKETAPEATMAVIERQLPGLSEAMRAEAQVQTDLALLDRSVAGIRGRTLIVNLPAGASPAYLFLAAVVDLFTAVHDYLNESSDAPFLADLLMFDAEGNDDVLTRLPSADSERAGSSDLPRGLSEREFAAFLERSRSRPPAEDDSPDDSRG